jgi:hypothetical protein
VADSLQYMVLGAGEGRALLKPAGLPRTPVRNIGQMDRGWNGLRFSGRA